MDSQSDYQHHLHPGTIVSDYRIESVLGEGGFGITYLATDLNLGKKYAIKEYLPSEFAVRAESTSVVVKSESESENYQWGMERFLDEARALASFKHKNINEVHRFFKANGTAYMVLEFVEGETLSSFLKREKQIPEDQLKPLLTAILNGLKIVHEAGYTHRDIKPGNIMLASNGTPVLIDFGAARQAMGYKSKSITTILTPGYAPVEQYDTNADDIGPWTDIYALGMVAYRCLTGCADKDLSESVARSRLLQKGMIDEKMLPAVEVGQSGYSESFLRAVDSAMAVLETERPQSVTDLLRKLELGNIFAPEVGVTKPEPVVLPPPKAGATVQPPQSPKKSSKAPLFMGGGIVVLLAVIIYLVTSGSGKNDTVIEPVPPKPPIVATPSVDPVTPVSKPDPVTPEPQVASPAQATLNVRATPARATIRVLNIKPSYKPGMALKPGRYHIEVSAAGYQTRDEWVEIQEGEQLSPSFSLTAEAQTAQLSAQEMNSKGEDFYYGQNGSAQDYAQAMQWYRKSAAKGYKAAEYNLGFMYEFGKGVAVDKAKALKWHGKAAAKGHMRAQFSVGLLYDLGKGTAEDNPKAIKWYRKSAEQGYAKAQFNLALMYEFGEGVAKDEELAVSWYQKAAEQGLDSAQKNLGVMYEFGNGVTKNKVTAVKWYTKAAEQGLASAQKNLGVMYEFGIGVSEDKAKAVKWYRKAAEQGYAAGQKNLGVMYAYGNGVAQDKAEAVKWYRKAAEQGYAAGQYSLALMYDNGDGVAEDDAKAVKWYRKAADQGYAKAQKNLGLMYEFGNGVAKDTRTAVKWYRKAAEQGLASGQYSLGVMYDNGSGIAEDDVQAVKWYRKAAEQDYARALNNLGAMYEDGTGVPRNKTTAISWYRKAAAAGSETGKKNLKRLSK